MRLRGGSALRLASAKAWLHRFTFVLLFGASLALMVLGKSESPIVERARLTVTDAVTPILNGLSRPLASIRQAYDNAREFLDLREENAALRQQQARLVQWQSVARQLEAENRALPGGDVDAEDPPHRYLLIGVWARPGCGSRIQCV